MDVPEFIDSLRLAIETSNWKAVSNAFFTLTGEWVEPPESEQEILQSGLSKILKGNEGLTYNPKGDPPRKLRKGEVWDGRKITRPKPNASKKKVRVIDAEEEVKSLNQELKDNHLREHHSTKRNENVRAGDTKFLDASKLLPKSTAKVDNELDKVLFAGVSERRPGQEKVKVRCERCREEFEVYRSQCRRSVGDTKQGLRYRCNDCCTKPASR